MEIRRVEMYRGAAGTAGTKVIAIGARAGAGTALTETFRGMIG